jgi:CRISPR/Cas system-associated endoribonuclease Cas2
MCYIYGISSFKKSDRNYFQKSTQELLIKEKRSLNLNAEKLQIVVPACFSIIIFQVNVRD